jgi:hypothetical protein
MVAERDEGTDTMSVGDQSDLGGREPGVGSASVADAGSGLSQQPARPTGRRTPAHSSASGANGPTPEPAGPPAGAAASGGTPLGEPGIVETPVVETPVIEPTGRGQAGSSGGGGSGPTRRRVSRGGNGSGPPVGPIAILVLAGIVLAILLGVILLNQGDKPRQETAPPCIETSVADALNEIADGRVTNIRASAAANDLTQFAVAVELDIEGGGCLSLPQGPESVDQRTAIIGAATIYNSQTEGRRINVEINDIQVPPTPTPAPPTETPVVSPTETPIAVPTETPPIAPPVIVPPAAAPATPVIASPVV